MMNWIVGLGIGDGNPRLWWLILSTTGFRIMEMRDAGTMAGYRRIPLILALGFFGENVRIHPGS